jgi:hypothetical protein
MNQIKLSDKYSIWRCEFQSEYSKDEFLKYVDINDKLSTHTNNNSVWMEIQTEVFGDINKFVKKQIEKISNKKFVNYAEHYWVYRQTNGFNMEWMHQHLLVHPQNRSTILTDYTFTYYIQTPTDISNDEGCIVFEDENKKKHKFLPREGNVFIFPADIRHTAIPTPNSKLDRVVYAGSLCIDIENQINETKNII